MKSKHAAPILVIIAVYTVAFLWSLDNEPGLAAVLAIAALGLFVAALGLQPKR